MHQEPCGSGALWESSGALWESSGDAMEIGAGIMDKEHQPAGNNTNTGVHTHIGILICTSLFSTPLHKICIKYL